LDYISFVTKKDSPGTFKAPFKASKKPDSISDVTVLKGTSLLLAFAALALGTFVAGCACYTPQARNDKTCIVLHQIIDCTQDAALQNLAPLAVAIIGEILNNQQSPNWPAIEARIEGAGIKDGGCILAQLEADFAGRPTADKERATKAKAVSDMLLRFKEKRGMLDVKYKVKVGDKVVLR